MTATTRIPTPAEMPTIAMIPVEDKEEDGEEDSEKVFD
jgi:hypothetical protein